MKVFCVQYSVFSFRSLNLACVASGLDIKGY